jgi:hypothetical protein
MTNDGEPKGSLFDTNAFVNFEQLYPEDTSGPVWDFLSELVANGVLKTTEEVIEELEKRFPDNKITAWVVARKNVIKVVRPAEHYEYLNKIVYPNCPGLTDPDRPTTLHADPDLLATAGRLGMTLVTDEVRKDSQTKPKNLRLPNYCDNLGILCICGRYGIPEFLKKAGLVIERARSAS